MRAPRQSGSHLRRATRYPDSWRFANGKAVEYYEYFDAAQVHAAMT
jgi:ketosteroid isomerase-like protein